MKVNSGLDVALDKLAINCHSSDIQLVAEVRAELDKYREEVIKEVYKLGERLRVQREINEKLVAEIKSLKDRK